MSAKADGERIRKLVLMGVKNFAIAERLGITRTTVVRWKNRYNLCKVYKLTRPRKNTESRRIRGYVVASERETPPSPFNDIDALIGEAENPKELAE